MKPKKIPDASGSRSFHTKVAGVTFEGRQRIVARCVEGEGLLLVRDPANKFDWGAVKVLRRNGDQIGFLPSHVSRGGDPSGLAAQMDRGQAFHARISALTGGASGQNRGVNIEILEGDVRDSAENPSVTFGYALDRPEEGPNLTGILFLVVLALFVIGLLIFLSLP